MATTVRDRPAAVRRRRRSPRRLRDGGITVASLVPTQLQRLLDAGADARPGAAARPARRRADAARPARARARRRLPRVPQLRPDAGVLHRDGGRARRPRHGGPRRSRASAWRSPPTARSSSPGRRSTASARCARATSAGSSPTGASSSPAARATSSSRAGRTSRPPRSRRSSPRIRPWWRRRSSRGPTRSGGRPSTALVVPRPGATVDARASCAATARSGSPATRSPRPSSCVDAPPAHRLGQGPPRRPALASGAAWTTPTTTAERAARAGPRRPPGGSAHRDATAPRRRMPVSAWMVDAIDPQPGQTVLELAAGTGDTGFLAAELIQPGGDAHLLRLRAGDARRRPAAGGGARDRPTCASSRSTRRASTSRPASLDGVLCRWGYMLMADPEAALRETRRVLQARAARVALAAWAGAGGQPVGRAIGARRWSGAASSEPPRRVGPGQFAWAREAVHRRAPRGRRLHRAPGRAARLRHRVRVVRRVVGHAAAISAACSARRSTPSTPSAVAEVRATAAEARSRSRARTGRSSFPRARGWRGPPLTHPR